jgi:hypothetical protein
MLLSTNFLRCSLAVILIPTWKPVQMDRPQILVEEKTFLKMARIVYVSAGLLEIGGRSSAES